MKVSELINELNKVDKEKEILLSSDEEGNSIKEIDGVYLNENDIVIYPFG